MGSAAGSQPPLTTTGVAPWAFQGKPPKVGGPLASVGAAASGAAKQPTAEPGATASDGGTLGILTEEEPASGKELMSGAERVRKYMKLLCPAESSSSSGPASWEAALMAETPTLLPTLKFHQLVFGHEDLGAGAFATVRYARAIQKGTTQALWPEYAVKVINTTTMKELGYEASVNREICVLRMLSHPGIARMVSSFRWRDGAYLVLEYASRGDLHSILVRMGKLPEDTARFFLGETIAALTAIHDIGFVYGDLKPENIVVTSSCHAKLTDFGGCRPITPEAKERTKHSLLKRLRDGDWRAQDAEETAPEEEQLDEDAFLADDCRVEGTIMYLSPEVVHGGAPTIAADAWALGCMMYQLLCGRPPVWVESECEEALRARIVSFRLDDGLAPGAAELSEGARSLADALLQADPSKRLSVVESANYAFFEGMDVFTLYTKLRGPELPEFGRAAPAGDARWQKRQYSKIWTVMPSPQDYAVPQTNSGPADAAVAVLPETDVERDAPFIDEALPPFGLAAARIESL